MLNFCNNNDGRQFPTSVSTLTYNMCPLLSAALGSHPQPQHPSPVAALQLESLSHFFLQAEQTEDTLPGLGRERRFRQWTPFICLLGKLGGKQRGFQNSW